MPHPAFLSDRSQSFTEIADGGIFFEGESGCGQTLVDSGFVTHDTPIDAGTLFRQHASFVANFLARIGVPRTELEDIVQEVFTTAHRKGGYKPGVARPTTWLANLAMQINANRRRGQQRARVQADMGPVERAVDPRAQASDVVASRQALSDVQSALASMDDEKRALFVLFEIEGEPCDAIAAALQVPVGTVYSRLHAARKQFNKAYRRRQVMPRGEARA